jgi:hypothetical protein
MNEMKTTTIFGCAVALALVLSFSSIVTLAGTMEEGENYVDEFTAEYMTVAPTIDGVIDTNEWGSTYIDVEYTVENDTAYTNESVFIYFGNDADYLYIALDFGYMTNADENDSAMVIWAIDVDSDGSVDIETAVEPYGAVMIAQNYSMTAFSWSGAYSMGGFGESVNFDDEHYMIEIVVPLTMFEEDEFGFAANADVDEGNETFQYPIGEDVSDILVGEIDADDWAVITLADVPADEEEATTSDTYALIMLGVGTVIFAVLLIAHKETIYKWIARGDDKYVLISFALGVIMLVLGILQMMYDWLGMIL